MDVDVKRQNVEVEVKKGVNQMLIGGVDSFSTVNSCSKAQKEQILTYYYALRMLS